MSRGRLTFNIAGAIAIVFGSFWITLKMLDDGGDTGQLTASTAMSGKIDIIEATYGGNCANLPVQAGAVNRVRVGNATDAVVMTCEKTVGACTYVVDSSVLGDPAEGCGKDFAVSWRCGTALIPQRSYLPGEAHGKSVRISCPIRP